MTNKPNLLSIWENLKNEKELAVVNGMSSIQKKEVLLIDGY